jgi:hypothetical protein
MKEWFNTTSWKTTSAGALLVIGGLVRLAFAIKAKTVTEESIMSTATGILGGIGLVFARDNNKTSEDIGATNKTTEVK